jgi:hypothetical protein
LALNFFRLTDQEANEGKQVVLKCKINCTPPPNISWFKGGNEITKDPRCLHQFFSSYRNKEVGKIA